MKKMVVSMAVDVTAYHRGTYWAGMIEQMGTLVYASDLESLREEVSQTVDFLMGCFDSQDEMVAYFNRRGILHTITEPKPEFRFRAWSLPLEDDGNNVAVALDARQRRLNFRHANMVDLVAV